MVPLWLSAQAYPSESVVFIASYYPTVSAKYVAMIDATSYVTQISSTSGFWLGVAMVHLLYQIESVARKVFIFLK